nr:lipopolysaccharide biosynthesis protein [Massilia polaris]
MLILGIIGSMTLARLLTPEETGVYSIGATLLGIAHVMRDFGVGQYLIQERELTQDKLRATLAVSFAVAWSLAVMIICASHPLAWFFDDQRLVPVMQVMSINFFLIPFTSTVLPLLRREMRFGPICFINIVSGTVSFSVAVSLAWNGFGYMSLAYASACASIATLLASVRFRPPGFPWIPSLRGIRRVAKFGAFSTGGTLIDEIGVAAPELIIGKFIGMDGVGIFSKAAGTLAIFGRAVTSVVSPVAYALFAEQSRGGGDVKGAYLTTVALMTAFSMPFFGFIALMAFPTVRVMFGPQWDGAAPLLRIMCLSSALFSAISMARYLFVATGHVKAQAKLDASTVSVRVAMLLAAAPFGLVAVAWAIVLGALFRLYLTVRMQYQVSGITVFDLFSACRKSALLALLCSAGPLAAFMLGGPVLVKLLVAASLSALLWVAGLFMLRHPLAPEVRAIGQKIPLFGARKR